MFDESRINRAAFRYYRRLSRVQQYVERNLDRNIGLTQVAEVAGLSPAYFSSFFRAKTGVPFNQWVNHLRVERAKQRIRERNTTITELAYSVGYRDLRTFERAFKRVTGQTPRSFKNRHRPS